MKGLLIFLIAYFSVYSITKGFTNHPSSIIQQKKYADPYKMIDNGESLLKEGDLIVRLNQDPASQFIKNFNRHDKSYSHAGIVLFEHGCPYVFHIVNGEENPDERLRKDSLKQFCSPRKNTAFGIFRYNLKSNEIKKLRAIIHTWYSERIRFDSAFDLNTNNRMYCSEMVSKALAIATKKRISVETTRLTKTESLFFSTYTHLPFSRLKDLKLISIDDLYCNSFCHLIKRYNY